MSEPDIVNVVRSRSSGTPGRSLNRVGRHEITIDSPRLAEEMTSADAFLAGISSCGVNLIERVAREQDVPLRHIAVIIEGARRRDQPADFARVPMRFEMTGPDQEQAEALLRHYQDG